MTDTYRKNKIVIREYQSTDIMEITQLFYDTVHTVNANDYSNEQLDVWVSKDIDRAIWDSSLLSHYSYVAEMDNIIVGFGDIDKTGYLDRLYVHKDYQNLGIGTAICNRLESNIENNIISVHASITAKPFFEKRGYTVIREQQVKRKGIFLKNYLMQKTLLTVPSK